MDDPFTLYGTDQPPEPYRMIRHGAVSLRLQGGALRHIHLGDVEIIRSIAFLARDRDWGTIAPDLGEITEERGADLRLTIPMGFRNGDSRLTVSVTAVIKADSVTVTAKGQAQGAFETNRAGFTVLHPIDGIAGAPATVTHADGSREDRAFPDLIDPWRPFMDIAMLEYRAHGLAVACAFTGDVFEMEDQRQWGDASFKTYNRPLDLPWPYRVADGDALDQRVHLSWRPAAATAPARRPEARGAVFPETALVLTADDATQPDRVVQIVHEVAPQRLLCHLDATTGSVRTQFARFAALQDALPHIAFDLELIGRFDPAQPPSDELTGHADAMAQAGFRPASVFVCPSVDRQSTPPGSDWPACPPLAEIHAAASRAFPDLPRGGGMASLFTELNRKRPPVEMLDFVSHGLCPIVHAADDLSVMETLEAVPHIARSARAIIGAGEYRIGPATIAMRQNPYGSRTIPNPAGGRLCMTDDDPRHRARFGAAYAMGLATALAPFGCHVWTPAAVLGPRGLEGGIPLATALRELAAMAGQPVHRAEIRDSIARLQVGTVALRTNLTGEAKSGLAPFEWAKSDV